MSKTVLLQFDDENYERVKQLVSCESLGLHSEGDAIREAVSLLLELADQEKKGYTQVVLRDPKRRLEREFVRGAGCMGPPAQAVG